MDEEEIEEWYSKELEHALDEHLAKRKEKKSDADQLVNAYKEKVAKIRSGYNQKYKEYFEYLNRPKPKEKWYVSYYRKIITKINILIIKIKLPFLKLKQLKDHPSIVMYKVKYTSYKEHKDLKRSIARRKFLERFYLDYALFLIRRYYKKYKAKMIKIIGKIKEFFVDKFIKLKELSLRLIEKLKAALNFFKKIALKLFEILKKVFEFIKNVFSKSKEKVAAFRAGLKARAEKKAAEKKEAESKKEPAKEEKKPEEKKEEPKVQAKEEPKHEEPAKKEEPKQEEKPEPKPEEKKEPVKEEKKPEPVKEEKHKKK
ncbi:hypothetical protein FJZ53_04175 [Candidatus Woesearchaeota archaeon]|nr:hypothetical protein [Candidatus Woesearchaeota archaeon]